MRNTGDRFSGGAHQGPAVVGAGVRVIWPPCHRASPIRQTGGQATAAQTRVACPVCDRAWTVAFTAQPDGGGGQVAVWRLTR